MSRRKKILIICHNTLHNDPRILRQIDALKGEYDITAAGYSDPNKNVVFIQLQNYEYKMIDYFFNYPWLFRKFFAFITQVYLKTSGRRTKIINGILKSPLFKGTGYYYERNYWTKIKKIHYDQLKNETPDLIIANDIEALPIAVKLKRGHIKLVFDAHEFHPEELAEIPEWREREQPTVKYLCNKYIKNADLMWTVSAPIAREYKKLYNVDPELVINAPPYENLEVNPVGEKIRLIHHGGAVKARLLEETINVIEHLDEKYTLDLVLVSSDTEYLDELKEKYKNNKRIKFLEPVPTAEISKLINKYDIGIYILPPLNFNNISALPNKFFEFIQARLAVAIGPMVAMAEIVKDHHIGTVSEEFTSVSLANAIKKMSKEEIYECKKRSEKAAHEFSSEKNKEIIVTGIKKLLA
jgi:glycosyltransferase involved in cell wall biosynthesis